MAPSLRQLQYIVVLSEELHFGRAAERLNISQPPLSASIRQLEEDLGVALFERTSRQVRLTAAGRVFAERARRMLEDLQHGTALARAIAASPAGAVRVGFVPSMVFLGLPSILGAFTRACPGVQLELREMNSAAQLDALLEGRLELGFVHQFSLPGEDGLEGFRITRQPFVCCLPADHPLARRESVSLAELGREPLILFARERAPAFHDHVLGLFARAGSQPVVVHHIANWLTIMALVGHGMGVALVPNALAPVVMGRAVIVPLAEEWAQCDVHCVRSTAIAHDGRDRLLDHVRDFAVQRERTA